MGVRGAVLHLSVYTVRQPVWWLCCPWLGHLSGHTQVLCPQKATQQSAGLRQSIPALHDGRRRCCSGRKDTAGKNNSAGKKIKTPDSCNEELCHRSFSQNKCPPILLRKWKNKSAQRHIDLLWHTRLNKRMERSRRQSHCDVSRLPVQRQIAVIDDDSHTLIYLILLPIMTSIITTSRCWWGDAAPDRIIFDICADLQTSFCFSSSLDFFSIWTTCGRTSVSLGAQRETKRCEELSELQLYSPRESDGGSSEPCKQNIRG